MIYGFAESKANKDLGTSYGRFFPYLWRTSFEVIVRQVPKIVDEKATLAPADELLHILLPICTGGSSANMKGLNRVCCTTDELLDPESSVPCWTTGKRDLAAAGTQLTVTSVDVPTLDERVSDEIYFYFSPVTLTDGSTINQLPYAAIGAATSDDDPFAESIAAGDCEDVPVSAIGSGAEPLLGHNGILKPMGGKACRFKNHFSLKTYIERETVSPTGLLEAYSVVDSVEPPPEIPVRVPLYEPSCETLENFVKDSRRKLKESNLDRNVKIEKVPMQETGAWVSWRRVYPFIKTSVHLFRYPVGASDLEQCEVYDSDEIEAECTKREYVLQADCVANSGTWLPGITSNKASPTIILQARDIQTQCDADPTLALCDDSNKGAYRGTALYIRAPDSSWGNGQVWGSTILSVVAMQIYALMW